MPALDGPEMTRVFRFMTSHLPKTPPKKAPSTARPQAALIFLHGSGDSGTGIREWLHHASGGAFQERLRAGGVQLICPSASARPYTLKGGDLLTVWFDRERMAYDAPEDADGLKCSVEQIDGEIDKLVADGTPIQRIAVAGLSMGGCLAMHVGLASGRHAGQLGAVASLSAFLSQGSALEAAVASRAAQGLDPSAGPPIFMAHGDADKLVPISWAQATRSRLEAAGLQVPPEVVVCSGLGHDMCEPELQQLVDFVLKCVGSNGVAQGGA